MTIDREFKQACDVLLETINNEIKANKEFKTSKEAQIDTLDNRIRNMKKIETRQDKKWVTVEECWNCQRNQGCGSCTGGYYEKVDVDVEVNDEEKQRPFIIQREKLNNEVAEKQALIDGLSNFKQHIANTAFSLRWKNEAFITGIMEIYNEDQKQNPKLLESKTLSQSLLQFDRLTKLMNLTECKVGLLTEAVKIVDTIHLEKCSLSSEIVKKLREAKQSAGVDYNIQNIIINECKVNPLDVPKLVQLASPNAKVSIVHDQKNTKIFAKVEAKELNPHSSLEIKNCDIDQKQLDALLSAIPNHSPKQISLTDGVFNGIRLNEDKKITFLDLSRNRIVASMLDEKDGTFIQTLKNLPNLTKLKLNSMVFQQNQKTNFVKAITAAQLSLTELELNGCNLESADLEALIPYIRQNKTLKKIDLRGSILTPQFLQNLKNEISNHNLTIEQISIDVNDNELLQLLERNKNSEKHKAEFQQCNKALSPENSYANLKIVKDWAMFFVRINYPTPNLANEFLVKSQNYLKTAVQNIKNSFSSQIEKSYSQNNSVENILRDHKEAMKLLDQLDPSERSNTLRNYLRNFGEKLNYPLATKINLIKKHIDEVFAKCEFDNQDCKLMKSAPSAQQDTKYAEYIPLLQKIALKGSLEEASEIASDLRKESKNQNVNPKDYYKALIAITKYVFEQTNIPQEIGQKFIGYLNEIPKDSHEIFKDYKESFMSNVLSKQEAAMVKHYKNNIVNYIRDLSSNSQILNNLSKVLATVNSLHEIVNLINSSLFKLNNKFYQSSKEKQSISYLTNIGKQLKDSEKELQPITVHCLALDSKTCTLNSTASTMMNLSKTEPQIEGVTSPIVLKTPSAPSAHAVGITGGELNKTSLTTSSNSSSVSVPSASSSAIAPSAPPQEPQIEGVPTVATSKEIPSAPSAQVADKLSLVNTHAGSGSHVPLDTAKSSSSSSVTSASVSAVVPSAQSKEVDEQALGDAIHALPAPPVGAVLLTKTSLSLMSSSSNNVSSSSSSSSVKSPNKKLLVLS